MGAGAWIVALLAIASISAGLLGCDCDGRVAASRAPIDRAPAQRIVSINPSLTAILLALGAGDALVGVDDYSALQQPEVASLPRVGGLFSPSLEAVVALSPDAVVAVPSVEQRDFRNRLEALGVRVLLFQNVEFAEVLENIAVLGRLVGREREALLRIRRIEAARAAATRLTKNRRHPRTVVVLQRDPLFVVGGGSFIDGLLVAAGAENLGASFDDPYPRVALEWLIDGEPQVLIDMTKEAAGVGDPLAFWSRWPAIPAVAEGRVLHLDPQQVTLPGPYLDRSIETLVAVLHGPVASAELTALIDRESAD